MEKDYDEYVVFLLGTDNFIRAKVFGENGNLIVFGMDDYFDKCVEIAKAFEHWNKNFPDQDMYSLLENWIAKNEKLIDRIMHGSNAENKKPQGEM